MSGSQSKVTGEQTAWLPAKRVRAITAWWVRRGWRARLLGRTGYRWELVDPENVCPCSHKDDCYGYDSSLDDPECLCEDYDYCLGGRFHTPMGEG